MFLSLHAYMCECVNVRKRCVCGVCGVYNLCAMCGVSDVFVCVCACVVV